MVKQGHDSKYSVKNHAIEMLIAGCAAELALKFV